MGNRFSSGKYSIAECDRCGFRYKLKDLQKLVIKDHEVPIKVCQECWEPDHPQLKLGEYPVDDPQGVREPRPDFAGYPESRGLTLPMPQTAAAGFIGTVTVVIS